MARWIHEFRSTGERALSDDERRALERRARRLRLREVLLAVLSVAFFVSGLLFGIGFTASGYPAGWIGLIGSVVLGCFLLSWVGNAGKLALLHRRALRLGLVEEFRRVRGDETARRMWAAVGAEKGDDEDEEPVTMPANEYWRIDERFEESLARTAGGRVEKFDAVARDGAVLWVEGKPVRMVLEPPVWEVVD